MNLRQIFREISRQHLTECHDKTLTVAQTVKRGHWETKTTNKQGTTQNSKASLTMCPFHIISFQTSRASEPWGKRKNKEGKQRNSRTRPLPLRLPLPSQPAPGFHRHDACHERPDVQREAWHCFRSISHPGKARRLFAGASSRVPFPSHPIKPCPFLRDCRPWPMPLKKTLPPLWKKANEVVVQLCVVSFGRDHRARTADVYMVYP